MHRPAFIPKQVLQNGENIEAFSEEAIDSSQEEIGEKDEHDHQQGEYKRHGELPNDVS